MYLFLFFTGASGKVEYTCTFANTLNDPFIVIEHVIEQFVRFAKDHFFFVLFLDHIKLVAFGGDHEALFFQVRIRTFDFDKRHVNDLTI